MLLFLHPVAAGHAFGFAGGLFYACITVFKTPRLFRHNLCTTALFAALSTSAYFIDRAAARASRSPRSASDEANAKKAASRKLIALSLWMASTSVVFSLQGECAVSDDHTSLSTAGQRPRSTVYNWQRIADRAARPSLPQAQLRRPMRAMA